jgi:hypothetical protein
MAGIFICVKRRALEVMYFAKKGVAWDAELPIQKGGMSKKDYEISCNIQDSEAFASISSPMSLDFSQRHLRKCPINDINKHLILAVKCFVDGCRYTSMS